MKELLEKLAKVAPDLCELTSARNNRWTILGITNWSPEAIYEPDEAMICARIRRKLTEMGLYYRLAPSWIAFGDSDDICDMDNVLRFANHNNSELEAHLKALLWAIENDGAKGGGA